MRSFSVGLVPTGAGLRYAAVSLVKAVCYVFRRERPRAAPPTGHGQVATRCIVLPGLSARAEVSESSCVYAPAA
jgi:hypothetical protein